MQYNYKLYIDSDDREKNSTVSSPIFDLQPRGVSRVVSCAVRTCIVSNNLYNVRAGLNDTIVFTTDEANIGLTKRTVTFIQPGFYTLDQYVQNLQSALNAYDTSGISYTLDASTNTISWVCSTTLIIHPNESNAAASLGFNTNLATLTGSFTSQAFLAHPSAVMFHCGQIQQGRSIYGGNCESNQASAKHTAFFVMPLTDGYGTVEVSQPNPQYVIRYPTPGVSFDGRLQFKLTDLHGNQLFELAHFFIELDVTVYY